MDSLRSQRVLADGTVKVYESHLLRRSFRVNGKVKHETLANLSALPPEAIAAVRAVLAGKPLIDGDRVRTLRALPHGHVAAVWAQAKTLGLPELLGPAGRMRDIAMALTVARTVRPASNAAARGWWADTTLAHDLGVADASQDEICVAMDWLTGRQEHIQAQLARRHLLKAGPAYFDLFRSCTTGTQCVPAHGQPGEDGRGLPHLEYAVVTAPDGRPLAVKLLPGATAGPAAFAEAVAAVKDGLGLTRVVVVGDPGMITPARVEALQGIEGIGWITCLPAPAIAELATAQGPLRLPPFGAQDPAEISHPDYPGEYLIACRDPALAQKRARLRAALLEATEAELAGIAAEVDAQTLSDQAQIGFHAGKVVGEHKTGKLLHFDIGPGRLAYSRFHAGIDAEAALDGIYIIRTGRVPTDIGPAELVAVYNALSNVERDFPGLTTVEPDPCPGHHRTERRIRAHLLLCAIAGYVAWHLREAWEPFTSGGLTNQSFSDLLDHLATLTRNTVQIGQTELEQLSGPTPTQSHAFELIESSIPYQLK